MFLWEWLEFPKAPCLAGKKTWWQLASWYCWNRARHLTCFLSASVTENTCNSTNEQNPLSNYIIYSVLRNRKVGRAKDLSARHRREHLRPAEGIIMNRRFPYTCGYVGINESMWAAADSMLHLITRIIYVTTDNSCDTSGSLLHLSSLLLFMVVIFSIQFISLT
jgi:hypothetical protein